MKMKYTLLFLLPLVFLGCGGGTASVVPSMADKPKKEMVWSSDSESSMSDEEYDTALIKYVELKYPKRVKAYKRQINTTTINGLMWQDNKDAKTVYRDWEGAKQYCKDLNLLEFSDWRLATIDELEKLYTNKDRLKNLASSYYWSSTTHASSTSYAWTLSFYDGFSNYSNKTNENHVRCVRAGQ